MPAVRRPARYVPKGTYRSDAPADLQATIKVIQARHAQRVNEALAEHNCTHRELAEQLGLSPGAVRHRVYGRSPISSVELELTAQYLGLSVSELLGEQPQTSERHPVHHRATG